MNRIPLPARIGTMLLPYAVVALGLYGLRQGLLAIALYDLGMAAWLLAVRRRGRPLALTRGKVEPGVLLGLLGLGAAAGPLLHLLWPVLSLDPGWEALRADAGLIGWRWSAFLLLFAVPNPVLEELVWRGSLGGDRRGPDASDLAFGLYHVLVLCYFVAWPWALLTGVALALAAWVWRRVAGASGGLLVPTLSHLAASLSLAFVLQRHG
jgi:hypothetical protein